MANCNQDGVAIAIQTDAEDMIGSFWSLELIALTLVLLVGAVAGAALRRTARCLVPFSFRAARLRDVAKHGVVAVCSLSGGPSPMSLAWPGVTDTAATSCKELVSPKVQAILLHQPPE